MNSDSRGGTPLYLQIAHHLEQQIAADTYPVGSLLPPEEELAVSLGVSRHTIRQAIGQLRRRGRLSARKGVGTRVEAGTDDWSNRFRSESRHDLFDFARETEMRIVRREVVAVRGRMAVEMGCRPGRKWHYLAGPRYFAGESAPFCWNEVYLDQSLGGVVAHIDVLRSALFQLVESHTGERIAEIQQEIRATHVSQEAADALGLVPGSLGMRLSRRYTGSGGRLLEYAMQTYPGESFVYRTTLSSNPDC